MVILKYKKKIKKDSVSHKVRKNRGAVKRENHKARGPIKH